ncbi:MAG: hypothetical protein ACRDR6_11650 [Pseudonocardiaceae bacterium]
MAVLPPLNVEVGDDTEGGEQIAQQRLLQRPVLMAPAQEDPRRVPDFGGPRVWNVREAARAYVAAAGLRRAVVSVGLPGATARAFRAGGNLLRDGETGTRTFEEFLAQRVQPGGRVQLTYHRK